MLTVLPYTLGLTNITNKTNMHNMQYGFRRQRSAVDLLVSSFAKEVAKTFDRVRHADLLGKLPFNELPPKLCEWTIIILYERSIQVLIDGVSFGHHKINTVSALAPTLALININD